MNKQYFPSVQKGRGPGEGRKSGRNVINIIISGDEPPTPSPHPFECTRNKSPICLLFISP